MNKEIIDKTNPEKKASKGIASFIKNNKMLTLVFAALIVIAVIWIWKNYQISNVKAFSQKQFNEKQLEDIKLFAKPYVWAIRKEMLTQNYQQVNLYASDMIHEKNFQSIMVSDANGLIISSTEKKSEGQQLTSFVKAEYLAPDSTTINFINDSVVVLNSPIMGFSNKLGVLTIRKKIDRLIY